VCYYIQTPTVKHPEGIFLIADLHEQEGGQEVHALQVARIRMQHTPGPEHTPKRIDILRSIKKRILMPAAVEVEFDLLKIGVPRDLLAIARHRGQQLRVGHRCRQFFYHGIRPQKPKLRSFIGESGP
jgi:hypothetical protein